MEPPFTIKDVATRKLLSLRLMNRYGDTTVTVSRLVKGGVLQEIELTRDEILAELNTRPHVPRKAEAKLIRKLRAQTGRSEESIRKDPTLGKLVVEAQLGHKRIPCSKQYYDHIVKLASERYARDKYVIE